ncbi:hypothetical protein EAO77_28340 [Streptomyces sp. t39]|nr:hypothetical protein EAO77_28340 [Streptomyces sp. t39]
MPRRVDGGGVQDLRRKVNAVEEVEVRSAAGVEQAEQDLRGGGRVGAETHQPRPGQEAGERTALGERGEGVPGIRVSHPPIQRRPGLWIKGCRAADLRRPPPGARRDGPVRTTAR